MNFRLQIVILTIFLGHYVMARKLWSKGVIHYSINTKDYDVHSQEIIQATIEKVEKEICVKFFPVKFDNVTLKGQHLYVTNPEKLKTCSRQDYDYSKHIIEMPIGYKCLDEANIARIIMEMLNASIVQLEPVRPTQDLSHIFGKEMPKTFEGSLLSPEQRHYINTRYYEECRALEKPYSYFVKDQRRADAEHMGIADVKFYEDRIWPLGVVVYGVEKSEIGTNNYHMLRYAMNSIELSSCIVFQEYVDMDGVLDINNVVWFVKEGGEDEPPLGKPLKSNYTINIETTAHGAPGHSAHVINNLMRLLGIPMMSNRFDRDNYITIHWSKVKREKKSLLETEPVQAFLNVTYDYFSVTHAPINYLCNGCNSAERTITPLNDFLWQKSLGMGKTVSLTDSDRAIVRALYDHECRKRHVPEK